MRTASLLLSTLLLCGCATDKPCPVVQPEVSIKPVKSTLAAHWGKPRKTFIGIEWAFVRDSDGRHIAEVTKYDDEPQFYVWHNGAGFGEYETKEEAMRHAEEIANELGDRTF